MRDLQRDLAGVLLDGESAGDFSPQVRAGERASAEARVAVYAHMYMSRLVEVLGEVYPHTRTLLGGERFDELAAGYVREHPSRSPSLRGYGAALGAYLARRLVRPAAAISLAALEWARYDVFDAEDQPILVREQVAALAAEEVAALPLRAITASRVVSCAHDVYAIFRALEAGEAPPSASPLPTALLVWRSAPTVFHRVVDAGEVALLTGLEQGVTLGLLCERLAGDRPIEAAAAEVFAWVGRWIADGLLIDPGAGP